MRLLFTNMDDEIYVHLIISFLNFACLLVFQDTNEKQGTELRSQESSARIS